MQQVRNGVVILLLMGVGYAVYTYVNKPEQTPPPDVDTSISEAPTIEMGAPGEPLSPGKNSVAEPTRIGGQDAPPFVASIPAVQPPAADAGRSAPSESAAPSAVGRYDAASPAPLASAPSAIADTQPAPTAQTNANTAKFADAWREAQKLLDANRLVDAHRILSDWYGRPDLTPTELQQLTDLLGQLAGTIIYSHADHLLEPPYVVRENETLAEIAQAYKVPWQLLAKINNLADPKSIHTGDKLKVVRGPFDAVLDLRRNEIVLQLKGQYAGRFKIVRTGVDPTQFKHAANGLQVREKENARGEHYVGLDGQLGIYSDDPTAGLKKPSEASIVLSARDAEDVYDILTSYESTIAVAP